jgi:hypothetical protein
MELLLCHLIGDYVIQSHTMAIKKTANNYWALYHAIVYTLPFLFLTTNIISLLIICSTHFIIDRFKIATYLTKAKNYIFGTFDKRSLLELYPENTPPFLSVWLIIILDNTLHLLINYYVLR